MMTPLSVSLLSLLALFLSVLGYKLSESWRDRLDLDHPVVQSIALFILIVSALCGVIAGTAFLISTPFAVYSLLSPR